MKTLVVLVLLSFNVQAQDEESEALRAMRLSCEKQKVALGCFNYANMLLRVDKSELADKYYEIGCKLEHSPSCDKEKWDLPGNPPPAVTTPDEAAPPPSPESTDFSLDDGNTINE